MTDPLFRAIPVEYGQLYFGRSYIDAQELGLSLQGLGKLANGIVHFYLSGQIARDSRLYHTRIFAGPPRDGSVVYDLAAIIVSGQLPLYAPILCKMGEIFIPGLIHAVIELAVRKRPDMEKIIDRLADLAHEHEEFSRDVHAGHMQDKAWMREQITKLTDQSRTSLRELVKPIGSSCRQIKLGDESVSEAATIDEPEAAVLSSKDKLEVSDMRQYKGVFEAVDTTNGACKFHVDGDDQVLRGKITDPALANPENVYTHSLDLRRSVLISAKPVTKDGEIVRLFISDGRTLTD